MKLGALTSIVLILKVTLYLDHVSGSTCPKQSDSPHLKIIVHPQPLSSNYAGNLTVTCNIRRIPASQGIISFGYLEVKQGSTNKTVGRKRVYATSDGPFNVTVVISPAYFVNESSLTCVCLVSMETGECTQVHKPFKLLQDSPPTELPELTAKVPWHKENIGIVALIISSAVALLAILVLILVYRKKKKNRGAKRESLVFPPTVPDFPDEDGPLQSPTEEDQHGRIIEINENTALVISSNPVVLGNGKFGSVILGLLRNKDKNKEKNVAVKMLKDFDNRKHRKDFENEVKRLASLDHPNIVRLLEAHRNERCFYIVMEYLGKGSLLSVLQRSEDSIGQLQLFMFARDIASGMEYLASKKVIHRDLAARNVLIGDDDTARISDFGLARDIEKTGQYITTEGYVPLKWVSLETLQRMKFTLESDVWSYGIVLWEIFSYGKDPYHFMQQPEATIFDLKDFLQSGKRLDAPDGCPMGVVMLMKNCWSPFPKQRPSFTILKESTQSMLDALTNGEPVN